MFSKPPYPILIWERNTERRCAAGEPPIRFHWPSNNDFVLRFVTRLSHLLRDLPRAERYMAPHPRKDKQ